MNPLDKYPAIRSALYLVQWVVNGVFAIAGAYFLLEQTPIEDLPHWYILATGIAPVLWAYLGVTAQTNVTPALPDTDSIHGGTGESDPDEILDLDSTYPIGYDERSEADRAEVSGNGPRTDTDADRALYSSGPGGGQQVRNPRWDDALSRSEPQPSIEGYESDPDAPGPSDRL